MQIQDPIHGYITLIGMYADIVDTPEFQRLRSVEQVSFRPVYPGARHDRFIHSLGTYHLAGKFADHLFRNLKADLGISLPADEQKLLTTTFRYAALLHDIGHAPFSHTTEKFFKEPTVPGTKTPLIWDQLCKAISSALAEPNTAAAQEEFKLFRDSSKVYGKPHEIMSAILLIENRDTFIRQPTARNNVDLALAARMVIGYTYNINDLSLSPESIGVRNCLIQLLNSDVMDVDRLDYMCRDTMMTGYTNAPLDLDCLAASVTAVRLENDQLALAYRNSALSVFDLMFQAKLSHDAWVISRPSSLYDAALLTHCIRKMGNDYVRAVFCKEALSFKGKPWGGKIYRLLSDVDISADLKARSGQGDGDFDELYTREEGKRRIPIWGSYYEYYRIFNAPYKKVTPKAVYDFFELLMKYMDAKKLFIFNEDTYNAISLDSAADPQVLRAADFLKKYLQSLTKDPEKQKAYNAVLLDRSLNLTLDLDPKKILIAFPKRHISRYCGKMNYASYGEMTGIVNCQESKQYFYLYLYNKLTGSDLDKLCRQLSRVL